MTLNELYSWLRDAVKVEDLNDYLYWFDLNMKKESGQFLDRIYENTQTFITAHDLPTMLKPIAQIYQETMHPSLHAQFNPNTNTIHVNQYWVLRYETLMSGSIAYDLHVLHELYHANEDETMWYTPLNYRQRHAISEVSAIYYSMVMSGFNYHPRLVEYYFGLQDMTYTQNELKDYLKERVNDYEIYRFA